MTKAIAKWLALALCAALTLSGCGLISIDKSKKGGAVQQGAVSGAQVVAEYDGGTVTYDEAMDEYQMWKSSYEAYGYTFTSDEEIQDLKQHALDALVQERIVEAKAKSMGLTDLADADRKAIEDQANLDYEDAITYYSDYLQGDNAEETRQNAVDYLGSIGYTLDSIKKYALQDAWQQKLREQVTKDVTVTDEQVKAAYDTSVEEDEQTFTEDTYNFENAATYGDTITWVPEGYRAVKHILLTLPEEDAASLSDLESQVEDINVRIEELQNPESAGAAEEGDAAADETAADATAADAATEAPEATVAPEEAAAAEEDFAADEAFAEDESADEPASEDIAALDNMTLPELQAKLAGLQQQLDELKAACMAKMQPKIDEIQKKIAAGEDFDKLIEAYGEDDGMKADPTMTNGYYVSLSSQMWDDAFTAAAMALEKVGDISQPVLSQSGVHIIKYIQDLAPGAVPLEKVAGQLREEALEQARTDLYDKTVEGWVAAAHVKTYVERMVDPAPAEAPADAG